MAIVAIMAGAITPVVFRELNEARARRHGRPNWRRSRVACCDFYEDTGRFPTEAEGLTALVVDPGLAGWHGPYVEGGQQDLQDAIRTDAFGQNYVLDAAPNLVGGGTVDVLVVSAGINHLLDAGRLNQPWDLGADTDDLYVAVSAGPVQREKIAESLAELEALAAACRNHFRDRAAFPAAPADLAGQYLDPGYRNAALVDQWNTAYRLQLAGRRGPDPAGLQLRPRPRRRRRRRRRPDGRREQRAAGPRGVPLRTRDRADRAQRPARPGAGRRLGRQHPRGPGPGAAFDLDGWGRSYGVNVASRVIYSPGPDGVGATTADNLPPGVGP